MALPIPNLDDRNFQDLVREARALIPHYCPEWTDHNLSDPGITLIELFAWMVDTLLYRLNQVPTRNYLKFMELIGVKLTPAHPATADVTFRLSAPQSGPVVIPRGTEVATIRTETEDAIVFTTDADLRIRVPHLVHFLITHDNEHFIEFLDKLGTGMPIDLFREVPQEGNAFYLGYKETLASNILSITMDCVRARGVGIMPEEPPLVWEYPDEIGLTWSPFEKDAEAEAWLENDGTQGLNKRGDIILHLPANFEPVEVDAKKAYWIRCRLLPSKTNQGSYEVSPAVSAIASNSLGGTIAASHAMRVFNESLGRSDGNPGQSFYLNNSPILSLLPDEVVEVHEDEGSYTIWEEVSDFSESQVDDRHFVCDTDTGEIQFGPAIRQPDGELKQYGAIPAKGSLLSISAYRCGGGSRGNAGRHTLTVLKSTIPYVASLTNRRAAFGGRDPENIENAMLRAPRIVRSHNRAVTGSDFETLALEASAAVARARCIQPRYNVEGESPPGSILLMVIPAVSNEEGMILPERLTLYPQLKSELDSYLDERRILTTELVISEPDYVWVSIEATVRVESFFDTSRVRRDIEAACYRFINPLTGGPDGTGWPFGRALAIADVFSIIQRVSGVEDLEECRIVPVDVTTEERGEATLRLVLNHREVLCSHVHRIRLVQE